MEHLSPSEWVNLGLGAVGSVVAGFILMLRAKQSLPVLAAELARLLGPVLREVLAGQVKDLVAEEVRPTWTQVQRLELDLKDLGQDVAALKERVGVDAVPLRVAP